VTSNNPNLAEGWASVIGKVDLFSMEGVPNDNNGVKPLELEAWDLKNRGPNKSCSRRRLCEAVAWLSFKKVCTVSLDIFELIYKLQYQTLLQG
jgi:hypothetical protein